MHSYETLAVIVLALSATPSAFSAPVLENQQQARASIGAPAAAGGLLSSVLKNVGISSGIALLGEAANHFLGGDNNSRRDTESTPSTLHFDDSPFTTISNNGDSNTSPTTSGLIFGDGNLEQRAPGLEETIEGFKSLGHSRREPLSASGIGKGIAGLLASTLASDAIGHFLNPTSREPQAPSSNAGKGLKDAVTLEQMLQVLVKRQLLEELD